MPEPGCVCTLRKSGSGTADGGFSPPETVELGYRTAALSRVRVSSAPVPPNRAARNEAKRKLVSFLWMIYTGRDVEKMRPHSLVLRADPLGKPFLVLDGEEGPAVSFTYSPGRLWACIAPGLENIGIDVASAEEFQNGYPDERVFARNELTEGLARDVGGRAEAAALLWSVKEAAVKALGCGFHLVSPREVTVVPSGEQEPRRVFSVGLADRARGRLGMEMSADMEIVTHRRHGLWMSVAASFEHMRGRSISG